MKKPFKLFIFILSACAFSAAYAQQSEYGQASYYDDSFQGSMTAYNVKYDKNERTASHKIHPFGTLLKVTRLDNKKSVIVKVIDKGPYIKGRIVDLSRRAASDLDMINDGVANVKVELYRKAISTSDLAEAPAPKNTSTPKPKPEELPAGYDAPPVKPTTRTVSNDKPTATQATAAGTSKATTKASANTDKLTEKGSATKAAPRLVKQDYTQYGLYKIQLERPEKKGFGVQVAALTSYEAVMRQIANLQAKSFTNILVSVEKGTNNRATYKVILGPHDTEAAANNYKKSLKNRYKMNGFVVDLGSLTY